VAIAVGLRAQSRLPGTEFLDAETKRQKSLLKCANAYRDQNPGTDWPEIPAETPYLASYRKRAVCGDWMVVQAVRYEPVSAPNSLIRAGLQGIFAENCLFRQSGPDFGSDDQRLSGKFPTLANREFLREIRDSSFRISELLLGIREVPIPPIPGAWLDRAAFQPGQLLGFTS
jgi:hypothetical protein